MKKLLIVVDYQNDFVTGSLGFPQAVALEKAIANKIEQYREAGHEILFTFDTHGEDYATTQEGEQLPIPHCIYGTEGWDLYGKVAQLKQKEDVCLQKPTFGSADLLFYLRGKQYASIELVGLVSNICVLSNAVIAKAALPEVPIIVDAACTAAADENMHKAALQVLEGIQVQVINKEA